MDPRVIASNGRVAAAALRGAVQADRFVDGTPHRVGVPVADLLRRPSGSRDLQLQLGQPVTVFEERDGWVFVQSDVQDYVGYLPASALTAADPAPDHMVTGRMTHAYSQPDFKSAETAALSFGALVNVTGTAGLFAQTPWGHVPLQHLTPWKSLPLADHPVDVAERFVDTPYLWGANTAFGIDCSGLVLLACRACRMPCPRDSDQQEAVLGETLPAATLPQRGDLLFWKGHVAWVSDSDTILHANAYHMAVAYEPLHEAVARIAAQGDGPVTRHARLRGKPARA